MDDIFADYKPGTIQPENSAPSPVNRKKTVFIILYSCLGIVTLILLFYPTRISNINRAQEPQPTSAVFADLTKPTEQITPNDQNPTGPESESPETSDPLSTGTPPQEENPQTTGSLFQTPTPSINAQISGNNLNSPTQQSPQGSSNQNNRTNPGIGNPSNNSSGINAQTTLNTPTPRITLSSSNHTPTPTPITNIQIGFEGPDGTIIPYISPSVPPIDVTWTQYINEEDKWSVVYPKEWNLEKSQFNGHEGISVYPPGEYQNIGEIPRIGLGLAAFYTMSLINNAAPHMVPVIVKGVAGTLYTQGVLGESYIAALFSQPNGTFGIASSISSPEYTYVYLQMLRSLTFY